LNSQHTGTLQRKITVNFQFFLQNYGAGGRYVRGYAAYDKVHERIHVVEKAEENSTTQTYEILLLYKQVCFQRVFSSLHACWQPFFVILAQTSSLYQIKIF